MYYLSDSNHLSHCKGVPMTKHRVTAISDHGEGFVILLQDWDDEESLKIRVGMFTPDVVIEIESKYEEEE